MTSGPKTIVVATACLLALYPACVNGSSGWQLSLSGAPGGSRVYLHLWRNSQDLGVSGAYGTSSDNAGGWSLSGNFGSHHLGWWQVQAVIGTATSQITSSRLFFTVS